MRKVYVNAAVLAVLLMSDHVDPEDALSQETISLEEAGLEESGHLHDGSNGMCQVTTQFYDGDESQYEST